MALPVGTVIASILSPEDFNAHMPAGEKWELANGDVLPRGELQKIVANSKYYQALNPANVAHKPDLQGVFLRGKNNKRVDSKGNPDGEDLPIGSHQWDDVGPHRHSTREGYANAGGPGSGAHWHDYADVQTGDPVAIGDHPRKETRPRNVTVNYYIRVT